MKSWFSIKAKTAGAAEIKIYDEIGMWGITARQFSEELAALGQVKQISLFIHSPGGDVFDGIAIYNLLKNHPATITVHIDGLAASMASVIAMAGNKVVMPENAMMMIHKPWGISGGNANEMRDYADLLDKVESVLIPAYANKTGKSADELAQMLEGETWLNGRECVEQGFADELEPAVNVMARLESKRIEEFEAMPNALKNMITAPQGSVTPPTAPEQQRINGIKDLFAMFGGRHQELQSTCVEDASCTVDQTKDKLLALMGKDATPSNKNGNHTHIYAGNGNITGDGIRQGLYARLGHDQAERGNPYTMMSLFDMAKASLTDRGISVAGFGNRMQIVNLAFTHTTSDFSSILAGGAEKSVLMGWQDSGETFQSWTKTGSLSNFHESKRVGLNGFTSLDKVPEGAEYKYVTTSDHGVPIALATYGNIFSITRQAIINDDLSQLTTIPQLMGRAASRTVGNLVYAVLTDNPKYTDNKALFSADHYNLIAKNMDMDGLTEARKAMRLQEDADGNPLNVTPAYIIVPAALEGAAMRTVQSTSSPFQIGTQTVGSDTNPVFNQNAGVANTVQNMGQVIVEPRLDKKSAQQWYVASAKGSDTIEVAYLDGMDTPYLEEQQGFTVDGVAWKVRIDAGVAALDYRGLVKSSGQA
ncbi:ClpP-like prohead protease/major capsid protein fusion protein [Pectobacterium betavasculorum]|uniref:ATP-dependent Clp protease proteolytic subunit n=1 Tax=Pectobacterium betavasculorum TaxID=55207 RepID=A0ABR4UZK5_9GAMM|nr:ClpP-like prohead protease/major capsid protein fusion protein [Pectobacterium betavasculorum]KFX20273.1 peptidase [Pectobacterium betavasculorum]